MTTAACRVSFQQKHPRIPLCLQSSDLPALPGHQGRGVGRRSPGAQRAGSSWQAAGRSPGRGPAQGPHGGEALHVLVGQDGLPLFLALGQCHVQWLGAHVRRSSVTALVASSGEEKHTKPNPLLATLCHHLKARQDKGCWGVKKEDSWVKLPSLPQGGSQPAEGTQKLQLMEVLSPLNLLRPHARCLTGLLI